MEIEMRRILLAALAVSVFVACQPATTELTEEMKAEIAAEIRQVVAEFWQTAEEVDIQRWLGYWPPEIESYFQTEPAFQVNMLNILTGADEVRENWVSDFAARSANGIVLANEHIAVLTEDLALHVSKGSFTVSDTLGNTTEPAPWTATTVWVRHSGEWKNLHMHQSWIQNN
jgi:hypothetical protein